MYGVTCTVGHRGHDPLDSAVVYVRLPLCAFEFSFPSRDRRINSLSLNQRESRAHLLLL
ncbi:MAG: hypothetical protein JWQ87_1499 [Candidatus Sulfotelmatobacter sp.]|nr:hypothetical protein [Candidatus Sulfotelmatobacter sp.]